MKDGDPGNGETTTQSSKPNGPGNKTKEEIIAERREIQEKLMKRFGKRRQGRKHVADKTANRSTDEFLHSFHDKNKDVKERLENAESVPMEGMDAFFKGMQNELIDLQERLAKACGFLPSYHFEQLNLKLDKLKAAVVVRREEVYPKPAFVFARKAKKPKSETAQPQQEEKAGQESAADALLKQLEGNEYAITIENLKLEDRKLGLGEINGADVRLSNLKNCKIILQDAIGALHMNNIEHCTIITGPVAGSVFVEHITHSTVHCATRQARIHYAQETSFYLHVNSKPIIENSDTVQVAPYTVTYDEFPEQLKICGIDPDQNFWDDVQDFQWLRQQQSPHWSVLPQDNRETDIALELDDDEL